MSSRTPSIPPRRRRSRAVVGVAVVTAAAFALSACAADATPGTPAGDPVAGGTLDLAFWPDNAAFACVDPFQTYWIEHRTLIRNFADSLTDQDPETGEIVPWLAESWSVDEAGTAYTFELRDDVTFSDGTAFDASSVQAALDSAAATLAELPTAYGGVYVEGYESTEVVDADTAIVHFSQPNAAFLQGTSTTNLAILAPSSYEGTPEDRCLGRGVIGSGPFELEQYTPGESTRLVKREGYDWGSPLRDHQGEAYLDAIDVTYVAEDSVRVGQLTSGEIDVAWPRNPFTENDVALIESSGDTVERRSLPGPASNYYGNTSEGRPLADPAVRHAVQIAIDRQTYAETVFGVDYPAVTSVFDTTTPYVLDQSDELAFDPDAAGELLDDAGWELGDDGIRERDGERLTLSIPISSASATVGDELLQDQLRQVGIEVELNVITAAERSEVLSSGDYDLVSTYYTRADPGVIQWIVDERYAGSKALAANAFDDAQTAEVQRLLDAGTAELDPDARAEIYAELQRYLLDEAVVFPVFERVQLAGIAAEVHGFRYTSEAFGDFADTWIQP